MQVRTKIRSSGGGRFAREPDERATSKSKSRFSLKKYYVDLITAEGHYFIGYSARLSLGPLKLNYGATLHHPAMTGIGTGPILSSRDKPIAGDSELTWNSPGLGFDGVWKPNAPATKHVLLETSDGLVEWNCLQPAAQVHLRTKSGKQYEGLGYAEFLSLTIPPWRLGLENLFWGRFVSESHYAVWIDWQGEHCFTLLILNGRKMTGSKIGDSHVECDEFKLTLEREATIRQGSLGETVISKVPSVLKVAPIEFLGVREEKFLSRGRLSFADGSQSTGWVIHERISWPRNAA